MLSYATRVDRAPCGQSFDPATLSVALREMVLQREGG